MITATRNWLRRNRTNFAIGFGMLGVGYVAGQYVLSKIAEAGERMSSERTAKENLRRRFQQNQEDCTITVQALLPTATENILEALPVESITHELQAKRAERPGRIGTGPEIAVREHSSGPPSVTDDDGRSLKSFQSESYVHASQMGEGSTRTGNPVFPGSAKSKVQLWNDLKINSITRSFTLLYTLSLLTLMTRIQLNLLGRRNYLSSVVSSASYPAQDPRISLENRDDDNIEQNYGNDFETNRKFLTFSWWLLHRGWKDIMEKVQAAVTGVFGPISPREDLGLERLSNLILEVRRSVEGDTPEERKIWLSYLLPLPGQEDFVLQEFGSSTLPVAPNPTSSPSIPTSTIPSPPASPTAVHPAPISPSLRRLLDETADLIESPSFSQILTLLLDTTFSHLTDQHIRSEAFKVPLEPLTRIQEIPSSTATLTPDPTTPKAKLATILAVITRQAHAIGNGMPNEYVQAIEGVQDLEAFAAVIYSSNFEFEIVGVASGSSPGKDEHRAPEPTTTRQSGEKQESDESTGFNNLPDQATGMFENVWGKVVG